MALLTRETFVNKKINDFYKISLFNFIETSENFLHAFAT